MTFGIHQMKVIEISDAKVSKRGIRRCSTISGGRRLGQTTRKENQLCCIISDEIVEGMVSNERRRWFHRHYHHSRHHHRTYKIALIISLAIDQRCNFDYYIQIKFKHLKNKSRNHQSKLETKTRKFKAHQHGGMALSQDNREQKVAQQDVRERSTCQQYHVVITIGMDGRQ